MIVYSVSPLQDFATHVIRISDLACDMLDSINVEGFCTPPSSVAGISTWLRAPSGSLALAEHSFERTPFSTGGCVVAAHAPARRCWRTSPCISDIIRIGISVGCFSFVRFAAAAQEPGDEHASLCDDDCREAASEDGDPNMMRRALQV